MWIVEPLFYACRNVSKIAEYLHSAPGILLKMNEIILQHSITTLCNYLTLLHYSLALLGTLGFRRHHIRVK